MSMQSETPTPRASQLFAEVHSLRCSGEERCHWCCAPCGRDHVHDDDPPVPYHRSKSTALVVCSPWICEGCRVYRQPRVSLRFLDERLLDRQAIARHSWLLTPEGIRGIDDGCKSLLYDVLLTPPRRFALALRAETGETLLQLAVVNQHDAVAANTTLYYTLDNIRHSYTVYELEHGLKHGLDGKMPGVRALVRFLGPRAVEPITLNEEPEERKRGRPPKKDPYAEVRAMQRKITEGE